MARKPSIYQGSVAEDPQLKSDVSKVADIAPDVSLVATAIDDGSFASVLAAEEDIRTVSQNVDDVRAVSLVEQYVRILAGDISNLNAVAAELGAVGNISQNMAEVLLVHQRMADLLRITVSLPNIDSVALNQSNIDSVHENIPEITNVVAHMEDIHYLATHQVELNTIFENLDMLIAIGSNMDALTNLNDNIDVILDASTYVEQIEENLAHILAAEENVIALEASTVALEASATTQAANSASSAAASLGSANDSETSRLASEVARSDSAVSAGESAVSATNSEASAVRSEAAAVNAGQSVTQAGVQAGLARTAADEAKASEGVTTAAELAAAQSASEALTSASEAKVSETNSKASETAAEAAKDTTLAAMANIDEAETNAAESAANALNSKNAANQSKLDAAGSASAALESEGKAKVSEDNAKASELASAGSVLDAAAHATTASNAAAAAGTSEANAGVSAGEAATSETNAAGSAASALADADRAGTFVGSLDDDVAAAEGFAAAAEASAIRAEEAAKQLEGDEYAPISDFTLHQTTNKSVYPASGFVDFGKHLTSGNAVVNEGLWGYPSSTGYANTFVLGIAPDYSAGGVGGESSSQFAMSVVAGVVSNLYGNSTNQSQAMATRFPQAPDGTVTYDSATGTIINHKTYVDPKYGTDAGGDVNEAVARAFEGDIKNGDFRLGDDGSWTTGGTAGRVSVGASGAVFDGGGSVDYAYTRQTHPLTEGVEYSLSLTADVRSGGILCAAIGGTVVTLFEEMELSGTRSVTFTAPAGATAIEITRSYNSGAYDFTVTNVQLKPVTQEVVTERVDFAFQESFLRKVYDAETDTYLGQVYPNGCIQSKATEFEGVATSDDTDRPDTFFAQYHSTATNGDVIDTDTQSRGLGVWLQDQTDEWLETVSGTTHHIYRMPNGDLVQWSFRIRAVAGAGNGNWEYTTTNNDATPRFSNVMRIKPQGIQDVTVSLGAGAPNDYLGTYHGSNTANREIGACSANPAQAGAYAVDGLCFALPLFTISRLNQGAYHPSLNEMGTSFVRTSAGYGAFWYDAAAHHPDANVATLAGCFSPNSLPTAYKGGATGENGGNSSAHPEGKFYDGIYPSGQGGVSDLRLSAYEWCPVVDRAKAEAKAKNGTLRGVEKLIRMRLAEVYDQNPNNSAVGGLRWVDSGENVYTGELDSKLIQSWWAAQGGSSGGQYDDAVLLRDVGVCCEDPNLRGGLGSTANGVFYVYLPSSTVGSRVLLPYVTNISVEGNATNGFTCKEVIGDPQWILEEGTFANGWFGYWGGLSGLEFKMTRKCLGDTAVSTGKKFDALDGTWAHTVRTIDQTNNKWASGGGFDWLYVTEYQAAPYVSEPSTNSPILGGESGLSGSVFATTRNEAALGCVLGESFLGKVLVNDFTAGHPTHQTYQVQQGTVEQSGSDAGKLITNSAYAPTHSPIDLTAPTNSSPAVKALTYAVSNNQQASLNHVWNELEYSIPVFTAQAASASGWIAGTWYQVTSGEFRGYWLCTQNISSVALTDSRWGRNGKGDIIFENGEVYFIPWDGTGWGDDGTMVIEDSGTYYNLNGTELKCGTNTLTKPLGWTKNRARSGEQVDGVDL